MSLYREARSGRRRLWIAGALVAVGLAAVVGLVLATTGGTQSQAEKLESLQDEIQPALEALELIPIHYESKIPITPSTTRKSDGMARKNEYASACAVVGMSFSRASATARRSSDHARRGSRPAGRCAPDDCVGRGRAPDARRRRDGSPARRAGEAAGPRADNRAE